MPQLSILTPTRLHEAGLVLLPVRTITMGRPSLKVQQNTTAIIFTTFKIRIARHKIPQHHHHRSYCHQTCLGSFRHTTLVEYCRTCHHSACKVDHLEHEHKNKRAIVSLNSYVRRKQYRSKRVHGHLHLPNNDIPGLPPPCM